MCLAWVRRADLEAMGVANAITPSLGLMPKLFHSNQTRVTYLAFYLHFVPRACTMAWVGSRMDVSMASQIFRQTSRETETDLGIPP
ncbi:hypothetical protein VNO77_37371 [Canavalia gladiata]|uniref:Uncharacterized protein n=1 Tax=Canavalia gladiata TaxID=3824 RepID=A0AAN9KB17_CANGL